MIKVKHKLCLYKKYNVDIWGYLKNNIQKRRIYFYKRKKEKKRYKLKFLLNSG
jgi:hypothetical protein